MAAARVRARRLEPRLEQVRLRRCAQRVERVEARAVQRLRAVLEADRAQERDYLVGAIGSSGGRGLRGAGARLARAPAPKLAQDELCVHRAHAAVEQLLVGRALERGH